MPVVRIGTTVGDNPGYDTVHPDDEHGAFVVMLPCRLARRGTA